jgi:hypothetical protein
MILAYPCGTRAGFGRVGWIVSGRELGKSDSPAHTPLEQEIKKSRIVTAGKKIISQYIPFH